MILVGAMRRSYLAMWQSVPRLSAMPRDHCIDGGNNCLSLPALIPSQISALFEPLDRVVIEHAGKQCADHGPGVFSVAACQQPASDRILHRVDDPARGPRGN